jgi:integral membrane protein (TIGR00529 family)
MDPSLCLIASIILILLLIRRFSVGVAVFLGAFTLGFLSLKWAVFNVFLETVTSLQTIKLIFVFCLAFTLAYSMQELKLLDKITTSALSLFGKSSVFVIPMLIGLLPMPGGAIVSAVMLRDVVKRFEIRAEEVTFLNYWFRHVWASIDPIYPSVIIALAVAEISYPTLFTSTYPVTLAMLLAGLPFVRKYTLSSTGRDFRGIIYISPVLLVIILTLLGLDIMYSLLLSIAVLYFFKKPSRRDLATVMRKVLNPRILVLIVGLLFYKDLIIHTNSAEKLLNNLELLGLPQQISAFVTSFIIGFATGIETGYSAIALPLLLPFTGCGESIVAKNLMLVFGAGLLGVMLSPLHLCLILTSEYYSANVGTVYKRYLVTAGIVLGLTIILVYSFV